MENGSRFGKLKEKVENLITPGKKVLPILAVERIHALDPDDREQMYQERSAILSACQRLDIDTAVMTSDAGEPISRTLLRLSKYEELEPLFQYALGVATDEEFDEFMKLLNPKKKKKKK